MAHPKCYAGRRVLCNTYRAAITSKIFRYDGWSDFRGNASFLEETNLKSGGDQSLIWRRSKFDLEEAKNTFQASLQNIHDHRLPLFGCSSTHISDIMTYLQYMSFQTGHNCLIRLYFLSPILHEIVKNIEHQGSSKILTSCPNITIIYKDDLSECLLQNKRFI